MVALLLLQFHIELFLNENLLFNKNPTINAIQIANACDISLDILPNSTKTLQYVFVHVINYYLVCRIFRIISFHFLSQKVVIK